MTAIRLKKGVNKIWAAMLLAQLPPESLELIERAQAKQDFREKAHAWFKSHPRRG